MPAVGHLVVLLEHLVVLLWVVAGVLLPGLHMLLLVLGLVLCRVMPSLWWWPPWPCTSCCSTTVESGRRNVGWVSMDATQGPLVASTACCCDLTSCSLLQQAFTRTMVHMVLRVALPAAM